MNISHLKDIVACPRCKNPLVEKGHKLSCGKCKAAYRLAKGIPVFLKDIHFDEDSAEESFGGRLRYRRFFRIFSPPNTTYSIEKKVLKRLVNPDKLTLNIGSSSKKIYPNTVNLDIGPFPNVDIVGDGKHLPFKDRSFDLVLIESVLEHIDEPEKVISESFRVLRKGGKAYISIPFVFAFHGSPDDFGRFTLNGLGRRMELAGFRIKESGVLSGPASTFSQASRYFLATLFSFNSSFLYSLMLNIFGWLTFPVKYLDILLNHSKKAHVLGSIIYAVGEK